MTSGAQIHGYDRAAVEAYLDQCAAECARLRAEIDAARARIARARVTFDAGRVMQAMLLDVCVERSAALRQSALVAGQVVVEPSELVSP